VGHPSQSLIKYGTLQKAPAGHTGALLRGNIGQIVVNLVEENQVVDLCGNQDLSGALLGDDRTLRIFYGELGFERVDKIGNSRIIELVPLIN